MAVPAERILHSIHVLRGERVLFDADLAALYEVESRALVQAVKRNLERFPDDFMFQLTDREWSDLKSQSVISSSWGGRRSVPYAFTELGVAMLSSVLNSERAIQVNISGTTPRSDSANALSSRSYPSGVRGWGPVMRAFTQLRGMLAAHSDLARKMDALERKYDGQFRVVFEAIRDLMTPPTPVKKPIGFRPKR
ncbi:MAG: ORF6N domain-containing protein [Geothrix sp.]|uniref:ORF6N domain-containing protein n=1 Tax=Geothrix sp. TaxID=1962974 RepID=UPI00182CB2F9|nr:ORF6N domain-containing protein [Geothrix sp.]NWJ42058.1 ORF6N domain-containing protein [Geothrix sp.]WIL19974.1 MAG: ORF6N domain-containing protein [Geothrix sp.]